VVSPADTWRALTTPANGARDQVAVDVVAAHLGVFQGLHRRHALALQRAQARHLALGLLEGLGGGANAFFGRQQALADGGVVQAHDQVAGAHRLAVVLEHLLHGGRDLGAQIGAALGLQRAADHRARGAQGRLDPADVFRRQQQHGRRLGRGLAALAGRGARSGRGGLGSVGSRGFGLATGQQRQQQGQADGGLERPVGGLGGRTEGRRTGHGRDVGMPHSGTADDESWRSRKPNRPPPARDRPLRRNQALASPRAGLPGKRPGPGCASHGRIGA
jgi:hypothetical protein